METDAVSKEPKRDSFRHMQRVKNHARVTVAGELGGLLGGTLIGRPVILGIRAPDSGTSV